jgi:hypothetical protein
VRRVEVFKQLKVFEGCRKEFLSENLKPWEKLRKDRPLSLLKNNTDKLCLEGSRGIVSLRAIGRVSEEEHLVISQEPPEKERMVGILRGESRISVSR